MIFATSYHDSDLSESYHKQAFDWPPVVVDKIMDKLRQLNKSKYDSADDKFDQMVDVGCGNGQSTRVFAPYFRSIVGSDASKEQIRRAEAQNNQENVRYMVGSGESLEMNNGSVDLLISAGAFHYMDTRKALGEFKRVLKPDGCVALFSYVYKDIVLDHDHHNAIIDESGIHILKEFYLQPFLSFIKEVNHPASRSYDRMSEIYNNISEFEKCRVDDIVFDWCITMEHFSAYEKSMPACRLLEESIGTGAYPLDTGLQKLKEFWKVEELKESDIHLRITMSVYLLLLNKF